MATMDDRHNCDQLKARADRLRDRQRARGMWALDDEETWREISETGSLNIWDDPDGDAWNEVTNQCNEWHEQLNNETEPPKMTPQTYVLTLTITTGTELDIALNALGNSDLSGATLETIQIGAGR